MIDGYKDAIGNPDADGNTTTDPDWDALNVHASEDGKTLTVQLSYPCSYFDKLCAFAAMSPVQQATVEANGDAWCTQPDTFVCNGPYMISDWIPSERIVLSKNPNYVAAGIPPRSFPTPSPCSCSRTPALLTPPTTAVRHSSSRTSPPMRSPA